MTPRMKALALTIALLVGSLMAGCDSTEQVYTHKGHSLEDLFSEASKAYIAGGITPGGNSYADLRKELLARREFLESPTWSSPWTGTAASGVYGWGTTIFSKNWSGATLPVTWPAG